MKPEELKAIDSQRDRLLEQLTVAEAAVRARPRRAAPTREKSQRI